MSLSETLIVEIALERELTCKGRKRISQHAERKANEAAEDEGPPVKPLQKV